jgi:DNA-directed RNA polymerase I subunit RPA1
MSAFKIRYYLVKLKLLEMGDVSSATDLQDLLQPSQQIFDEDEDLKKDKGISLDAERTLRSYEQRYAVFATKHAHFGNVPGQPDSGNNARKQQRSVDPYIRELQAEVIDTFQKAAMAIKACENCGAHSPPLRKDGYTKLFQKPMPKRLRATMIAKRFKAKVRIAFHACTAAVFVTRICHCSSCTQSAMESLKDYGLTPVSSLPNLSTHASVALSSGHKSGRSRGAAEDTISATSSESESDHDDDDGAEGDYLDEADSEGLESGISGITFSDSDRYLVPIEVEAQLRLLWLQNQEILDFIWLRALHGSDQAHKTHAEFIRATYLTPQPRASLGGAGHSKSARPPAHESAGWRMFFTRVVLVPSNRFRPPGKVGDMVAEHPQNTHLKKVMIENNAIRELYGLVTEDAADGAPGGKARSKALRNSLSAALSPSAGTGADGDGNSAEEGVNLSKVVSHWIELQQAVNCYMDSSKDSNVLAQQGPAGIRQILERKEGLFRRHMMGKRVNFCCRSVISPDNYIGTNEIGIPVHFAKSLHYPTPVNNWNVKYLRTLVQRGPFQYPGELRSCTVDVVLYYVMWCVCVAALFVDE